MPTCSRPSILCREFKNTRPICSVSTPTQIRLIAVRSLTRRPNPIQTTMTRKRRRSKKRRRNRKRKKRREGRKRSRPVSYGVLLYRSFFRPYQYVSPFRRLECLARAKGTEKKKLRKGIAHANTLRCAGSAYISSGDNFCVLFWIFSSTNATTCSPKTFSAVIFLLAPSSASTREAIVAFFPFVSFHSSSIA